MKISSLFRCFKKGALPKFIKTKKKADDGDSSVSGLTNEIVDVNATFPIEEALTNSDLVQPNSTLSSFELVHKPQSTVSSSNSEESVTSVTSEGTQNTFYTATAMLASPENIHFKRSVNGYSSPEMVNAHDCSSSNCSVCFSRLPSRSF